MGISSIGFHERRYVLTTLKEPLVSLLIFDHHGDAYINGVHYIVTELRVHVY